MLNIETVVFENNAAKFTYNGIRMTMFIATQLHIAPDTHPWIFETTGPKRREIIEWLLRST